MNKTLLERWLNNKRITTSESLQKRSENGSKNHVTEIEKLTRHCFRDKETYNIRINDTFP